MSLEEYTLGKDTSIRRYHIFNHSYYSFPPKFLWLPHVQEPMRLIAIPQEHPSATIWS
jgi:hypothetical protein